MSAVVLVIQLLLALMLIGIVLIQRTNQSGLGLGDSGSGGMGGMMSGRSQANMLTRATALIATAFVAVCLLSAVMNARSGDTGRTTVDIEREAEKLDESAGDGPAAPLSGDALPSRADDSRLLEGLSSENPVSAPSASEDTAPAAPVTQDTAPAAPQE